MYYEHQRPEREGAEMKEIDLYKCNLTIFGKPFICGWILLGVVLVVLRVM
jgi:hypothetical protein